MQRDARQVIAGVDVDVAIGVCSAVERALDGQMGAEDGTHQAIVGRQGPWPGSQVQAGLDALTPGGAGIGEIAGAGGGTAADENDVVVVAGQIGGQAPRGLAVGAQDMAAAGADLRRMRHHLAQRRVGDKGVGHPAGLGGVGTAQFSGGRHPVGFAVGRIGDDAATKAAGGAQ